MNDLRALLMQDEGLELKPYLDTKGIMSIGVGRNLEANGISSDEALYLLDNDIKKATAAAATFKWFDKIDPVRKDVIVSMVFNMGLDKFCGFKRMIAAMERGDFPQAATEMLASMWSAEVGKRAARLAGMMQSGSYPS